MKGKGKNISIGQNSGNLKTRLLQQIPDPGLPSDEANRGGTRVEFKGRYAGNLGPLATNTK